MDQHGSKEGSEKWSDAGCILKIELTVAWWDMRKGEELKKCSKHYTVQILLQK